MVGVFSLALLLGLAVQDPLADPRVKPGASFVVPFPGLPQTLGKKPSELHVRIPRKYEPTRKFPLFLWLNGGEGHPGINTGPVDEDHWVVISMPLYKVNPASTPAVENEDAGLIWSCYRTMLGELERLVPNIHPEARVAAGFSNGANCQAVLLNRSKEFRDAFKGYVLWEGGNMLDNFKALPGKSLFVLYGEKSLGKYGAPIAASASKAGADADFVEMKGVGHDAPASYNPQVRDWILRKVLFKDLPNAFRGMTEAVKHSRWPEAVRQYNRVSGLLVDDAREEVTPTREAFQKICAACEEAVPKLPGTVPSKATVVAWRKFATEWTPCPGADKVREACNRYGEAELADLQGQPKSLRKFLEDWEGFAVRRAAVAQLDALASKDLEAVLAKHKGPALLGPLQKLAKEYDGTPSARKALEQAQQVREEQAAAILDQIKQLASAAERKRAALELIRSYDGTRAAAEARGLQ
jgi:hypothetical protein